MIDRSALNRILCDGQVIAGQGELGEPVFRALPIDIAGNLDVTIATVNDAR